MLIIVTATRYSQSDFDQSPLGRSLQRIAFDKSLYLSVSAENKLGLPVIYNKVIAEQYREHEVVFMHDDIWLDDIFFAPRIQAGLNSFDVIGLAGNRILRPDSPAWHVKDDTMRWDAENLSGIVCHGDAPFGQPAVFGPFPARVQLLDGALIAARISSLLDSGVRFDEHFDFHFYDLDFSRQANNAGLKVGTWPISVTHVSGGAFGSDDWERERKIYQEKWQNTQDSL
ncbi:MAG: glycosyltransferase family protein [Syntrophorhabdaceae bacterium]|nr:glycosyltransferase family protein [Syntrophorhabdaceae bacterium]